MNCGGDTDTAGAIAGALAGTVTGESGMPDDWIAGLADWPRGTGRLRQIAERVCEGSLQRESLTPVQYFWPALLLRNVLAFVVTLVQLVRRLAPPY